MAKLKAPTPQELYRERKQREEQERNSFLPPGLINHGNTCFMNSVLQGLLATRLLSDLVHFNPIPPATQNHSNTILLSKRSPQLTNGHNLAGDFDQQWVDTMPIGDTFLRVMHRAWDLQARKQRETLSPRPILTVLGKKYDQYLDFAQQDAHEFLRILLDAMRMEEQDIIKKRQPVVEKKRRRATLTSSDATIPDVQAIAEEDKLISLADMIFGGRLTSILVCQKCKHVSQTYEDFNDLSLSIKAEDYAYRKRDRLKNFAKRLTTFPSTSLSMAMEMQRSSSVPPSPREREGSQLGGRNEAPVIPSRRRSLDIATDQDENGTTESDHSNREQNKDRRVEFVEGEKHNGDEGKEKDKKVKKEGQDDTWTKLGRRISVSVGLTKGKGRKTRPAERGSHEFLEANTDIRTSTDTVASEKLKRISLSDPPRPRTPENHPIPETQRLGTPLAKLQEASSTPVLPDPPPPRPSLEHHASSRFSIDHRARSPKPPPATAAETAYLQKILADVGSGSSNPFAIFKPPSLSNGHSYHTGSSGSPQGVWLGLNQFSGLEECLRMFTAVEILDGENMVGCRRCWKIQNGVYSKSSNGVEDDEDSDAEPPSTELSNLASTAASHKTSLSSPGSYFQIPTSASTPVISYFSSNDSSASVSSLPTGITSVSDTDLPSKSVSSLDSHGAPEVVNTPGGLPIPRISTTAPDQANGSSSVSSISLDSEIEDIPTNHHLRYRNGETSVSSFTDSLPVPPRHRHTETDDESSGAESDASASSSYSVNTTTPSSTQGELPTNRLTRKPSRPKPVIMRPAYKRYLIATPPPVLVVHLKRFQQISKTYMMSFSHGFKKLDDYITFPEHLDLTPFLAPKKEDYGLGKRRKLRGKRDGKEKEKCMYRLYAVVVHIGNMLGGHYIAYTALPEDSPVAPSPVLTHASTKAASQTAATSLKPKRQWAHISDTNVRLTTLEEVLQAKAYICMYERC